MTYKLNYYIDALEQEKSIMNRYADIGKAMVYAMKQGEYDFDLTLFAEPLIIINDKYLVLVDWYRRELLKMEKGGL